MDVPALKRIFADTLRQRELYGFGQVELAMVNRGFVPTVIQSSWPICTITVMVYPFRLQHP
ncbi:hypothetical protein BM1_06058 [Bipolaris maydis]|nr:hypothetical protein BM1_06058 [Bipolaris maydis]